jgi:hypothetical protein
MWHEWGRIESRIGYWWKSQRKRALWEDQEVDGWITLELNLAAMG